MRSVRRRARTPEPLVVLLALAALAALAAAAPAASGRDDKPKPPDYSKGALYGRVLDVASGKPVPDATVAVTDAKGKVLSWTRTNKDGEYALGADCLTCLNLRPSHRRGLLEEVCKAVGDVAMAPVRAAVDVVKNPAQAVKSVAVSAATGNPAPAVAQVAAPIINPARDPKAVADQTRKQAAQQAVETVVAGHGAPAPKKEGPGAGMVQLAVSAAGYKDISGPVCAYWLEPPVKPEGKGERPIGLQAWLSTVKLAPSSAADKKSVIEKESLVLADAHVEPALVPAGGKITVSVKLQTPAGPARKVRVFAREEHKDTVVELLPGEKDKNTFTGEMQLDPKCPAGKTVITVAALRQEPVEVKLDKKGDALPAFVKRLDDMDGTRPYEYDPRIMASENRLDASITVLDPKQATPTTADAPAPPGGAPAPTPAPKDGKGAAEKKGPKDDKGAPAPAPGNPADKKGTA